MNIADELLREDNKWYEAGLIHSDTFNRRLHQHRQCRKYEKIIHRIRLNMFDYEDESPEKADKARRIIELCKDRCKAQWERQREARLAEKYQNYHM